MLCTLEYVYNIIFRIVSSIKSFFFFKRIPLPVISVGNISSGGTGKSVVVRYIADAFSGAVILSRGYKGLGEKKKTGVVVSLGNGPCVDVRVSGDEPYMLGMQTKAAVIIGKNRYASYVQFSRLNKTYHPSFVILDDGYQHVSLARDLDIVLLDARFPFENGHCFPAGPLREKNLVRAHIVILTHADLVLYEELCFAKNLLKLRTHATIFSGKHAAVGLRLDMNTIKPFSILKHKRIIACAGIGSFSNFLGMLKQLHLNVAHILEYPDHHMYTAGDYALIKKTLLVSQSDCIVTTAKDWVKLQPLFCDDKDAPDFYFIDIAFQFLTLDEDFLFKKLISAIVS